MSNKEPKKMAASVPTTVYKCPGSFKLREGFTVSTKTVMSDKIEAAISEGWAATPDEAHKSFKEQNSKTETK